MTHVIIYQKQYGTTVSIGMFGFQQFTFQARIMKLWIICLNLKMKTLSGDYHQLYFK